MFFDSTAYIRYLTEIKIEKVKTDLKKIWTKLKRKLKKKKKLESFLCPRPNATKRGLNPPNHQ